MLRPSISSSDDKVEESRLSNAFDSTCRAWEVRRPFPSLYTRNVLTMSHRRHVSVFPICTAAVHCRSAHAFPFPVCDLTYMYTLYQGETIGQKLKRLSLVVMSKRGPPINPPERDDSLLATHPSDHNAVYVDTVSHKAREKRVSKTQKRKARVPEKMKQGKPHKQTHERGPDHDVAFLVPVPIYYGYGIPRAACAEVSGGFGVACATVSNPHPSPFVSDASPPLSTGLGRMWGTWRLW